jgi:glycosyltransferase involved in cell wall biosynthesis
MAVDAANRLEKAYRTISENGTAGIAYPRASTISTDNLSGEISEEITAGKRILITHPEFDDPGGVARYWKCMQDEFTVPTVHFSVGKRVDEKGILSRIRRLFVDYWKFVHCLKKDDIALVHINPSLDPKSFIRDGVLAMLARAHGKKTVVSFHGWQKPFEIRISRGCHWLFKFFFGRADAFIVLSNTFKEKIERWGIKKPIYTEVTTVSKNEIVEFDIGKITRNRNKSGKWKILFLSRILKTKGIYETIQATSLLQTKYPDIELVVAGNGDEIEKVKKFTSDNGISNVVFPGYVRGKEKQRLFEEANIFCLPSYSEGFPVAVVEAMSFGLPVITRPVGGLNDFFKNGEHGFMSDSVDPEVLANKIESLFLDRDLYKQISLSNYQYAQSHFLTSDAVSRLERIYKKLLDVPDTTAN